MEPWPCSHCCRWQFPGKGPRRGRDHPGESCWLHRVPCLTLSLVWVSFRSHGWLQHGRRPEGARGQRTSRLLGSCQHLVSPPLSNRCELELGEKTPGRRGDSPFVLRVPWLGSTYFVFQSSFLHSVGWKIHVCWVQTLSFYSCCLRMLREEEGQEYKPNLSLTTPPPTTLPLLHPHFELGDFFFLTTEFPVSWWEHGDEACCNHRLMSASRSSAF